MVIKAPNHSTQRKRLDPKETIKPNLIFVT